MGDRVAVLKFGVLQQFASPAELYDRPRNAFVAGFIGSPAMNLFTAPVTGDQIRVGGGDVALDAETAATLRGSGLERVTVGIRPESLALTDAEGVAADVALLEDLGSDTFLYANLTDPAVTALEGGAITLVARCPRRTQARIGDGVRLRQIDTAVHLFHPDTGARLN